jgi:hypothetical protein
MPELRGATYGYGGSEGGQWNSAPLGPLPKMDFVRTYGTKFIAGSQSFYFAGTNMYWLGPSSVATLSDKDVASIIKTHAANGLKVIRFWGFGHGWDSMTVNKDGIWTLKDAAFARLDLVISLARRYGIRVIMVCC